MNPNSEISSLINALLAECLSPDNVVEVLEAGGGSATRISIKPRHRMTVLDISSEQLQRNTYADEKICADIQNVDLGGRTFDLVVCWDVLEHLENPLAALDRIFDAVGHNGILLIGAPNAHSLKGAVTRFSPHWFHIAYYRAVRRQPDAGKPGHAPFPTYMRSEMSFESVVQHAKSKSLTVREQRTYVGPAILELSSAGGMVAAAYFATSKIMRLATSHRFEPDHSDYFIVAQRT